MTPNDEQIASVGPSVANALREDVGSGDLTASLMDADTIMGASIIARESLVLCGQLWVDEVFAQLDSSVVIDWYVGDGQSADSGDVICKLTGPARTLLTGERTALNFLQTLSATATTTARYVNAIAGTEARILDTRKTIPGLRLAQKYAVTCGGGQNHRVGLYDAILIKENHIKSAGSIGAAVKSAQQLDAGVLIEVEVESLDEFRQAIAAGAERILLDNFSLDDMHEAVAINQDSGYPVAKLEASGNITLDSIRDIAKTGVDYISTGAITKNIDAIDLSMLLRID
ncbi:MAG TPA: carboxylating nicotinate-nucleotide diphosphorylase [Woeseiaceae bacterium]|nr:carboxylating nicotinate-nucleotide diphosphorylase [Woeseiaceae bacterium]